MSLLDLRNKTNDEIVSILDLAIEFKNGKEVDFKRKKIVANLFFEASTRTHYSFEMAAKRLGAETLEFYPTNSSLEKAETFYDTIKFFESIESDAIVIRHEDNKYFEQLNNIKVPILNGGDGTNAHPTQSLLDLMTIYEQFNTLSNLKVLIVGDIKHSRVAHSNIDVLQRLNNEVYLCGPDQFQEEELFFVDIDEY
ncbi:MAG: aspartate carbamoyltransferase, partial [Erysipelotrichales bacterium]